MGWNTFLNFVIRLKREYEKRIGPCSYECENNRDGMTCINRWIEELNDDTFRNEVSGIRLKQNGTFVIAHYDPFFKARDRDGSEAAFSNFFRLYDGLYMECRGVVIDIEKEKLVLVPFRKFMNLNERPETEMEKVETLIKDAHSVEFSEKLDGSMISVGVYEGNFTLASSFSLDQESEILSNSRRYLNENPDYLKMIFDFPDKTFIFEHVFPDIDPHIVRYEDTGLYLVGIRNLKTGAESSYAEVIKMASKYHVLTTRVFDTDLKTVVDSLDQKSSDQAEGFVVNIDGFKVKIKYNDYVLMHGLISSLISTNTLIKALADNRADDLVSKVPEGYRKDLLKRADQIMDYVGRIENTVSEYESQIPKKDRKTDMIWIEKNVPKEYHAFVRNRYLKREEGYLRAPSGRYRTLDELSYLAKI